MRRICLLTILIVVSILACGCTESPAKPAPVTPALPVTSPIPVAPVTTLKQIDVTAWTTEHSAILQYNGGKDTSGLTALKVQIDNQNGPVIKRTFVEPVIGKEYEFPYTGTPDARTINVIGVFSDGTEQTILLKYF